MLDRHLEDLAVVLVAGATLLDIGDAGEALQPPLEPRLGREAGRRGRQLDLPRPDLDGDEGQVVVPREAGIRVLRRRSGARGSRSKTLGAP